MVFGIFKMLGDRFSPRFMDLQDQQFWKAQMPGAESAGGYGLEATRCAPSSARPCTTSAPPAEPPTAPGADPAADPFVAEGRRVVDELAATAHAIGELMLEVAPAHLSDDESAGRLAVLCAQIGEPLERGLASRRYVLSGDRRARYGTVL
ncbi:hypothetical protein [Streptomyces sp. NPDC050485]|uniref:hypothetical protein n=1 Tax=Streptomyces sp. NPDC050485 TaxID=3365617 RepID=UPI0037B77562